MKLAWPVLYMTLAIPAFSQDATLRYAEFADLPTAQALSAAAWAAVRCTPQPSCDVAQITQFVYPVIGLTNGHYAIVIHTGDVYQGEHMAKNDKSLAIALVLQHTDHTLVDTEVEHYVQQVIQALQAKLSVVLRA